MSHTCICNTYMCYFVFKACHLLCWFQTLPWDYHHPGVPYVRHRAALLQGSDHQTAQGQVPANGHGARCCRVHETNHKRVLPQLEGQVLRLDPVLSAEYSILRPYSMTGSSYISRLFHTDTLRLKTYYWFLLYQQNIPYNVCLVVTFHSKGYLPIILNQSCWGLLS